MPDRPKRVAAIHDLSGFGRCSLSVILPTLSVMGVQVCPVPTTVFPPTPADWARWNSATCPILPFPAWSTTGDWGWNLSAYTAGF